LINWHYKDEEAKNLCQQLLNSNWQKKSECFKSNYRRQVYRHQNTPAIHIKKDTPRSLRNLIKNLWRNKCQKEFQIGITLQQAQIPVVNMLAWGKEKSTTYLVSQTIPKSKNFQQAWQEYKNISQKRTSLLQALANLLKKLVEQNINHPDLHNDNILVTEITPNQIQLHLVDLYGITIKPTQTKKQLLTIFSWLNFLLNNQLTNEEKSKLLKTTLPNFTPQQHQKLLQQIQQTTINQNCHKWRTRKKKYLKNSSQCNQSKITIGTIISLKNFPVQDAKQIFEHYLEKTPNHYQQIKDKPKRKTARITHNKKTYVIKEFCKPIPIPSLCKDHQAWLHTQRMQLFGGKCATAYAWLKLKDQRGLIIFQDFGQNNHVNEALLKTAKIETSKTMLTKIAILCANMHNCGLIHTDIKLGNVILPTGKQQPAFIDTDRVLARRKITMKIRIKYLQQVMNYGPPHLSTTLKKHFLKQYAKTANLNNKQTKILIKKLIPQNN